MGALDSGAAGLRRGQARGIVHPVTGLGSRRALVRGGRLLPLAAIIALPGLRAAETQVVANEEQTRLLQGDPLFVPLSMSVIEELAASMRPVEFEPDQSSSAKVSPATTTCSSPTATSR